MTASRKSFLEEGIIAGLLGAAAGLALGAGVFGVGGGWVALRTLLGNAPTVELAQHFAAAPLLERLAWAGMPALGVICALVFGLIVAHLLARQPEEWHVRGPRYVDDQETARLGLRLVERAQFSASQKERKTAGLVLGGVEFSRARETAHMLVLGLPGSGKTTILSAIIAQALARGDRVLVHDPKGDFLSAFARDNETVVLGPWDSRARPWDVARDVPTPAAADQFARACFPRDDGGANQFFVTAAREVLSGLVRLLQSRGQWQLQDLAELLAAGPKAILDAAHAGNPLSRTQVPDANNPGSRAVLAELSTGAAWIPVYAAAFDGRARPFSITSWALGAEPGSLVVLNSDARYSARAEQIFGGMLAALADAIASPAMPERSADEPGLFIVADELPQLSSAAQAALLRVEEIGRSRGVRVVKALQDPAQLRAREGADKADAARSMQQTRIYCRLSPSAAAQVCRELGDREIERLEFPLTTGQGNKRIVREKAPVLRVDSLMGLRVVAGEGVELIASIDDFLGRLLQPFAPRRATAPTLVPNPLWDSPAAALPRPSTDRTSGAGPHDDPEAAADADADRDRSTDPLDW